MCSSRLSTDCIGLDSCPSDSSSAIVEACVDIAAARSGEPPVGSSGRTASALKVVRWLRGYVLC